MNVFYFGGYLATPIDVSAWRGSLQKKLTDATIFAYAWPNGASAGDPLAGWTDTQHLAELIDGQDDGDTIIIGHSSGCAYANAVAGYLLKLMNFKQFRLIALDGFTPCPELMAMPGTVRWSALNMRSGATSRNYVVSQPPHYRVWDKAKVSNEWPLHFSLVNLAVSDDHPTIQDGYINCDANTDVLGIAVAETS
jgi:hypothetical protein